MKRSSLADRAALALLLAALCGLSSRTAPGAGGRGTKTDRPALGRCVSPAGALLRCAGSGKDCRALEPQAAVHAGDLLIALPGTRAEIDLRQGTVRLSLLGHLPKEADDPVLGSAVRLDRAAGLAGLELTVEGGRALLAHRGKKGGVRVRLHFGKDVLRLDLAEPGTEVAVEMVSRWPAGAPFSARPKPEQRPVADGVVLLLKGQLDAQFNDGAEHSGLRGRVMYHWNSHRGPAGPLPYKEVPAWAAGPAPDKDVARVLDRLRQRLAGKDAIAVLREAVDGADPSQRVLAVHGEGAIGDIEGILKVLNGAKDAKVRRAAAATLRHLSGRGAAEDVRIYEALVKDGYKPGQAENVMYLLHGFTGEALAEAATYETLIDYLQHGKPAVRELAAEQLYRLVPQGRAIAYDAAAGPDERARAHAAWRRLIPAGKLPPAPK